MAPRVLALFARQYEDCTLTEDGYLDEDSCYVPFWATREGVITKWSLFLGFIVIVGLYLLLGYLHAQKRVQKGLPPLGYHRFLVPRATLARVDPNYRYPQPATVRPYHPDAQQYDMYAMPPPVYDPNAPRPPMYEPPAGSTKVDLQQREAEQSGSGAGQHSEYAPPAGPPPSSSQAQDAYSPPAGPPPSWAQSQDTYAPPPGPPPSSVQPQGTGNTKPFRN